MVEVEKSYVPVTENPTFALGDVEAYEAERYKVQDNSVKTDIDKIENIVENTSNFAKKDNEEEKDDDVKEDVCPECGKPKDECECKDEDEDDDKKKKYSLDEIPEYIELQEKYSALETSFNELTETKEALENQVADLIAFKAKIEKQEKEAMINSFYMLSDEDKQDVVNNIDTYSLEDIEAKLAIICVRNKVSFNLEGEKIEEAPTTYSLNGGGEADYTPAWIKSLQSVAKDINN